MMPVLLGFAGLAVDTSIWFAARRSAQNAADAGAVSAAHEILRSGVSNSVNTAALQATSQAGFGIASGASIDVFWPPSTGQSIGDMNSAEVVVSRPAQLFFARPFLSSDFTIGARAVAAGNAGISAGGCIYALNETVDSAIKIHGTAIINLDCGLVSNSNSPVSINQVGNSCVNANAIQSVGGSSGDCLNPNPITGIGHFEDPLDRLPEPSFLGCNHSGKTQVKSSKTATLSPGTYCGDLQIQGTVHFNPGLYHIRGGDISFNSHSVATGTGVTFFMDDSGGELTINGGSDVNLSAPTDPHDDYANVLFYQDRDATGNLLQKFNGGSDMVLNGALYFAGSEVQFNGGSDVEISRIAIVSDTVDFGGNTNFQSLIESPLSQNGGSETVRLIE